MESLGSSGAGGGAANTTSSVIHGLKLKLQGQTEPSACYTYALSPFTDKPVYSDWKIIVNDENQSQHIRCHALQPGDKIKDLISLFKRALVEAVVLINTHDNYTLAPEFTEGMEKSNFLVIILTKSDGNSLVEFLEKFYQDVLARLDVVNSVDVAPALSQQQPSEIQQQKDTTVVTKDRRSGSEATGFQRLRQAFGLGTKTSADLKNEVKWLMFTSDTKEPVVVLDDDARFIMVMSAFTVYEKQAKPGGSHSDVVGVLCILKQHFNECFPKDVPLYLILSYRFHITHSLYDCDELKRFITGCIDRLENMELKQIASSISTFLEKDDFKVSFLGTDGKEFNTSVLFLLECACVEFARVSYNIHRRLADTQKLQTHQGGQKPFCQHFVYSRMMWTSLTLRLRDRRTCTMTRRMTNLWQENLLKHSARVNLDLNAIQEVKRGLELGRLLRLSANTCFNYLCISDFLVVGKTVRPFSHVETYFRAVESYIIFEADLADFLANIRANYDLWLRGGNSQKLATASADGTLLGTIKEGIGFVDCMNEVCTRRKVDHTLVESDSIRWVLLLLHLVNFTDDKAELYLKPFLMSHSKVLKSQKCRIEIKKYILNTTQANFPHMSIQQFGALFKAFKLYSPNIVEKFLKTYKVQPNVKIDDPTWHSFIDKVVVRFGGARNHFFFLDFLRLVASSYVANRRQKEFVLDLLRLSVPKLFAVDEGCDNATEMEDKEVAKEFTFFLSSFISRHALKHCIMTQMTAIMNSISEERDDFQQLILGVLQREVMPEFKVLQSIDTATDSAFKIVLQEAVNTLCKDLSWLKELTTKQKFCWGLVAVCCSKINISRENLDWVHSYDKVLKQVGYIYTVYCNGRRLTESQCIIIEQLPEEVEKNPSENFQRYFECIREIQAVLKEWQVKILHQEANYDEILMYTSSLTHLYSLGNTLCSASLICDAYDLNHLKSTFLQEFETLNILLLKYIPEQPDAKWCTLPALLLEYGVALPQNLQLMISEHVLFPGDQKPHDWEQPTNSIPPATTGMFQPGHDVCLRLSKNATLHLLAELIKELGSFQEPLLPHLEMLVFFRLNKSAMFDQYLRGTVQISHNTEKLKLQSLLPSSQFSDFSFSVPILSPIQYKKSRGEEGLPMKIFIQSLENTEQFLYMVMRGDIKLTIRDTLDVQSLNITEETSLLIKYSDRYHLDCTGIFSAQRILELCQWKEYIQTIQFICHQYQLKNCMQDSKLIQLVSIADSLIMKKITQDEAERKLKQIKEILCFTSIVDVNCLKVFRAVGDSVPFHRLLQDASQCLTLHHQRAVFQQLQHDIAVVNDLPTAISLMSIFDDKDQDFRSLLSLIFEFPNIQECIQKLRNINANLPLVSQLFSDESPVLWRSEKIQLLQDIDAKEQCNAKMSSRNLQLQQECSQYKAEIAQLSEENLKMQKLIDSLQKERETLQQKQLLNENQNFEQEMGALKHENRSLKRENQTLHDQNEVLQQKIHSLQEDNVLQQQQLLLVKNERDLLQLAQQESVSFGIEPWKVSRDKVEKGDVIGGGGWGAVSEGKLQVAIKQFYPTILSPPNVARLKREMRMLALIRHPNLVQFIAVVFDEQEDVQRSAPYIITELLDTSLRVAYQRNEVPKENMVSIFIDTARALDYLHRRHEPIIHRDVSSANVLLKRLPNGRWVGKLSDLGSANLAREAYTMNEGAIIYCAPEAFTNKSNTRADVALTPKVDVYSYGIMLCEVATHTLPGDDIFPSLLTRVQHEWPQLHHLVNSCIKAEPQKRPSMEDVVSILNTWS